MKVMRKTIVLQVPLPARAGFAAQRDAADQLDEIAAVMTEAGTLSYATASDPLPMSIAAGETKPATDDGPAVPLLAKREPTTIAETMEEIGRAVKGDGP